MKRKDFLKTLIGLPLLPVVLGEAVESEPKEEYYACPDNCFTGWEMPPYSPDNYEFWMRLQKDDGCIVGGWVEVPESEFHHLKRQEKYTNEVRINLDSFETVDFEYA